VSFIPVLKYGLGLGVFGFTYWLLNSILALFISASVHETGTTFNILHALWTAGLIAYMIFGGWWLIRMYDEQQYQQYR
jgi:hypothetical protein